MVWIVYKLIWNILLFRKEKWYKYKFRCLKRNYERKEIHLWIYSKCFRGSKPFVWKIVNGERRLTYENALLIARVFGKKPDDLFYSIYLNNDEIKKKIAEINRYKKYIN